MKHAPIVLMAIVKFTAIVADMRNKLNGTVFSRNKGGAYARTKVTPLNPQSTYQAGVRNRFTNNSQAWRGLTDAERQGWIDAAPNFPRTNQFGDTVILAGNQLYSSLNNNLVNTGTAAISTAPTPASVTSPLTLSAVIDDSANTVIVTYTATPVPANTSWLLFATAGVSPGRKFLKRKFRQIAVLPPTEASPFDASAEYIAKFGAVPPAGQRVGIRIVAINTVTGQAGSPLDYDTIVVP